ncbi:MAG: hypothetical protein K2G44_05445 [Clostridia bacterium]|nr:hypothetical protein [Clostridia bacterium]
MEERLIDNEREIKIKRKRGGDDVVDALAEDDELPEEEELVLELPEGEEYDEELVGLTPTELKEKLARREKAKRQAEEAQKKLMTEGAEKLAAKDYGAAEAFFEQSLIYGWNGEAGKQLWRARTKDFTDTAAFYRAHNDEELVESDEEVRKFVLGKMGKTLEAEREEYRKEAVPLKEKVEAAIAERRAPFLANKKYYSLRLKICLAALVLCLVWVAVAAGSIYSTAGMLPVWLAIAGGALALVCLGFTVFYWRKSHLAKQLCEANERLSSTEEGKRLEVLEHRLVCLDYIFGE